MSEINIDDLLDNMDRFQKEYESSIEGLYESGKSLFKLKAFLQTAREKVQGVSGEVQGAENFRNSATAARLDESKEQIEACRSELDSHITELAAIFRNQEVAGVPSQLDRMNKLMHRITTDFKPTKKVDKIFQEVEAVDKMGTKFLQEIQTLFDSQESFDRAVNRNASVMSRGDSSRVPSAGVEDRRGPQQAVENSSTNPISSRSLHQKRERASEVHEVGHDSDEEVVLIDERNQFGSTSKRNKRST